MEFFSLWSRSELLALITLVVCSVGVLAALLVVPEIRRLLKLDSPRSGIDRRRRLSLFFAFVVAWLVVGVVAWRFLVEPKLVKWSVISNLEHTASPEPTRAGGETPRKSRSDQLSSAEIEILRGKRTEENIGGGTVVLDMWDAQTVTEISVSQIPLLFETVSEPDALPNLALNGVVRIHEVRLYTSSAQKRFVVTLKVENLTDGTVRTFIPKGQIFENKKPRQRRQNLASSNRLSSIALPPHDIIALNVDAFCINKNWKPPDGDKGNVTIFKIRQGEFRDQMDLWSKIDAVLKDQKSK